MKKTMLHRSANKASHPGPRSGESSWQGDEPRLGEVSSAGRLLVVLTVTIFAAELLIMRGIDLFLPDVSVRDAALIDSFLLVLTVFPALYLMVFRPLRKQILRREKAQQSLRQLNQSLESLVEKRTSTLNGALEEIEEAREKLNIIINSIAAGLVVTDIHHHVMIMNPAAERILGLRCKEVSHRPLVQVIQSPALARQFELALRVREDGWQFDFERESGGRGDQAFRGKTSVIRDRRGRQAGLIILIEDVTRERQVDRLKSELISTTAHELQTPLTTIIGFADLLRENPDLDPGQKEEGLAFICEKGEQLSRIIDDLLHIGRVEQGQPLMLNMSRFDPAELLKKACRLFDRAADARQVELKLEGESVELNGDPEKIEQVVENGLRNAIRYSPKGSHILISGTVLKDCYQVAIEDQGIGMTPEQQQNVFEKFYRADSSDTAPSGAGIGLSVAKSIVESHQGRIWTESEVGKGTTLFFTLPLG